MTENRLDTAVRRARLPISVWYRWNAAAGHDEWGVYAPEARSRKLYWVTTPAEARAAYVRLRDEMERIE